MARIAAANIGPDTPIYCVNDYLQTVNFYLRRNCTLLMDEFYSHYFYRDGKPGPGPVSAARVLAILKFALIRTTGLPLASRPLGSMTCTMRPALSRIRSIR